MTFTKRLLGLALAASFALYIGHAEAATPKAPSPQAMAFAQKVGPPQLADILVQTLSQQEVVKDAMEDHGVVFTQGVLKEEITKGVTKYGPAWNHNLAMSYQGLLTDAELGELAFGQPSATTQAKLQIALPKAGAIMKKHSDGMLNQIATEVLANTKARLGIQ